MRMQKLYLSSVILGYTAGFSSLWLMHVILPIYIAFSLFKSLKLKRFHIKKNHLIFLISLALSIMNSEDFVLSLKYLFYYICGITAFVCARSYANTYGFEKYVKVIFSFIILNMMIGLLENFGIMRLPFSPFSPYVSLLGHDGAVLELASDQKLSKATGFFWNPNNFAFVIVIFSPILLLHPNIYIKYLSFVAIVVLLTFSQSRACLVAFVAILPFILHYNLLRNRNNFLKPVFMIACVIMIATQLDWLYAKLEFLLLFIQNVPMYIDLALSGVERGASVFTRLTMYGLIWSELLNSPLSGLGLGGAELVLIASEMHVTKPHNFILMITADFGLLFATYWLLVALLNLVRIWKNESLPKYFRRGLVLSSLAFVPASFSPSIIVYMMMFWLYLAMFSVAAEYNADQ